MDPEVTEDRKDIDVLALGLIPNRKRLKGD